MIDVIRQNMAALHDAESKLNKTREFLQVLMLKILFDKGSFGNIAFVGGTALRILYGVRRYSEDMDFSLTTRKGYDFTKLIKNVRNELEKNNIAVELKPGKERTVNSCFIKFPALTERLGLIGYETYKLQIKIEVDTVPPDGAVPVIVPLTERFLMAVTTYDLPSLFATKLHACFFRKYTKGRDYYDLVWYLGKKIEPNFPLLNNAIMQTEKKDMKITSKNYTDFLRERITAVNFESVRKDVYPFLEDKNDVAMLERDSLLAMIAHK